MVFLLHLTNVRWLPCLCLNILSTGLTPASCFLLRNQRCLVLSSLKYFFILLTFTHCFYFICKDTQLSVRITGMTIFDDSFMFHFFTNLKHHKYVKCFNLIWIQSISFCHKLKGKNISSIIPLQTNIFFSSKFCFIFWTYILRFSNFSEKIQSSYNGLWKTSMIWALCCLSLTTLSPAHSTLVPLASCCFSC